MAAGAHERKTKKRTREPLISLVPALSLLRRGMPAQLPLTVPETRLSDTSSSFKYGTPTRPLGRVPARLHLASRSACRRGKPVMLVGWATAATKAAATGKRWAAAW